MEEVVKLLVAVLVLVLGIPIGNILAKATKEELRYGRKWYVAIIIFCLIFSVLSLIYRNDALLFSLLFIAVVTSRSLKTKKMNKK